MRAKIGDWGGSSAVRIPVWALKKLNLRKGSEVEFLVENGALTVRPVKPVYTLEQLVKEAEGLTPPDVIDDEPVGEEWPSC